eukprot:267515-Pyramimonas_sp.AAC.1
MSSATCLSELSFIAMSGWACVLGWGSGGGKGVVVGARGERRGRGRGRRGRVDAERPHKRPCQGPCG